MKDNFNVLFLCTGNSARSIMAEAIMNQKGRPNFVAFSAGSHPKGSVHPGALRQLEKVRLPADGYRSKVGKSFPDAGAPRMDFVFTVCDNAAAEVCPIWPGQPMTAHWGIPDPAAAEGSEEGYSVPFTGLFNAGPPDQSFSLSSAEKSRQTRDPERNRQNRRRNGAMNNQIKRRHLGFWRLSDCYPWWSCRDLLGA